MVVVGIGAHRRGPSAGRLAVADIIKGILELLSEHRCAVVPESIARGHLPKRIVSIYPIAGIAKVGTGALVGLIVLVGI